MAGENKWCLLVGIIILLASLACSIGPYTISWDSDSSQGQLSEETTDTTELGTVDTDSGVILEGQTISRLELPDNLVPITYENFQEIQPVFKIGESPLYGIELLRDDQIAAVTFSNRVEFYDLITKELLFTVFDSMPYFIDFSSNDFFLLSNTESTAAYSLHSGEMLFEIPYSQGWISADEKFVLCSNSSESNIYGFSVDSLLNYQYQIEQSDLRPPELPDSEFRMVVYKNVSLQFSPDGAYLLIFDQDENLGYKVIETESYQVVYEKVFENENNYYFENFLDSGQSFFAYGHHKWYRVSYLTGEETLIAESPEDSWSGLSPNGEWLIVQERLLTGENTWCNNCLPLTLTNLSNPDQEYTLEGTEGAGWHQFINDSKWLLLDHGDNLLLWDLEKKEQIQDVRPINHEQGANYSLLNSGKEFIIANVGPGDSNYWNIFNGNTGETILMSIPANEPIAEGRVSPDGHLLFLRDDSWNITIWDLRTGELLDTVEYGGGLSTISADGDFYSSYSYYYKCDCLVYEIYSIGNNNPIQVLETDFEWVDWYDYSEFSYDNNFFAASNGRDSVDIWSIQTGESLGIFTDNDFSYHIDQLATTKHYIYYTKSGENNEGKLQVGVVQDYTTGEILIENKDIEPPICEFSPSSDLLFCSVNWELKVWDISTGSIIGTITIDNDDYSITGGLSEVEPLVSEFDLEAIKEYYNYETPSGISVGTSTIGFYIRDEIGGTGTYDFGTQEDPEHAFFVFDDRLIITISEADGNVIFWGITE